VFLLTWALFNGIISYLTSKCGGNVPNKGVVEITTRSISFDGLWNALDLGTIMPSFESENEPE
jgi:hypothetical protein